MIARPSSLGGYKPDIAKNRTLCFQNHIFNAHLTVCSDTSNTSAIIRLLMAGCSTLSGDATPPPNTGVGDYQYQTQTSRLW